MFPKELYLRLKKLFDQGQYDCHQINHCRNKLDHNPHPHADAWRLPTSRRICAQKVSELRFR